METQTKVSAKNVFLNLGATVALYTVVISLVNLLFTIINTAYPKIVNGYNYSGSSSISWPVATLVIFFPIFIALMWLLEKQYKTEPELQNAGIHKWLTYITLFISGLTVATDLITVLYYFIDGQEITTGFILKILALFVIAASIFTYYISDVSGKLTHASRNMWRIISLVIVLGSIVWGFAVLGSPHTQRLYKYDEQKVTDLMSVDSAVVSFYQTKGFLPSKISELSEQNYGGLPNDPQSGQPYEYVLTGQSAKGYNLCAEFNKASSGNGVDISYPYGGNWNHPAGHYCFAKSIDPSMYVKVPVVPAPSR